MSLAAPAATAPALARTPLRELHRRLAAAAARACSRHFHDVYAYCRWADDLADETGGGQPRLGLLRWWRDELLPLLRRPSRATRSWSPCARPSTAFASRREPFLDLLFAFEQDQLVKRYATFDQLLDYCRHSANPVGHLVLYLCECLRRRNARRWPTTSAPALQLANFWQDVARDLDIGRVYLPERTAAASATPTTTCTPAGSPGVRRADALRGGPDPRPRSKAGRCSSGCRASCVRTWSCSSPAAWRSSTASTQPATTCWRAGPAVSNGTRKGRLLVQAPGGGFGRLGTWVAPGTSSPGGYAPRRQAMECTIHTLFPANSPGAAGTSTTPSACSRARNGGRCAPSRLHARRR